MIKLEDELGDIIAKAKAGIGYSTNQLADATGLSDRDIKEIEAYKQKPDKKSLQKLADALSLDYDKLSDIANDNWVPVALSLPPRPAIVITIAVPYGNYSENCYILGCSATRLAAVIDPGGAVEEIENQLSERNLTLDLVLITHAHRDHTGGLSELLANYLNVRVSSSETDRDAVMQNATNQWIKAEDGESIPLSGLTITPLSTPGHTPGSTCYSTNGICFVGDTLFAGSIGRPMDNDAYDNMLESIRSKVLSLPDRVVLLPGHGPVTTAGEEKLHNPFF